MYVCVCMWVYAASSVDEKAPRSSAVGARIDDDDDGRINFNVAYSPKTARTRNS